MSQNDHIDLDQLQAYRAGTLAPEEVTVVQNHLADCSVCTEDLLDLAAWQEPLDTTSSPEHERQKAQAFKDLEAQIAASTPSPEPVLIESQRTPRPLWASLAAAALILVALGMTIYSLNTRARLTDRETRLAAVEGSLTATRQALEDSEAKRLELADDLEDAATRLQQWVDTNPPPRGESGRTRVTGTVRALFTVRNQGDLPTALVAAQVHALETDSGSVTIRLDLTQFAHLPSLTLSLTDPKGRPLWQEKRANSRLHGDLGTQVSFETLQTGRYYLRISEPNSSQILQELILEVSASP